MNSSEKEAQFSLTALNNLNSSIESLNILINDIKSNPKKYVHFSVFGRK